MKLLTALSFVAIMSQHIIKLVLIFIFSLNSLVEAALPENALAGNDNRAMDEIDLTSLLTPRVPKQKPLIQEALLLIDSMKLAPSCNRLAVSELVSSCQSIGGRTEKQDTDIYLDLELVRSLYAARLAICELREAKAAAPDTCSSLVIVPPQKRGKFGFIFGDRIRFRAPEVIQKPQLESCLQSLETRPQWWTSYSNSRQNAVVICQAARDETEKEELLELYRSILNSSAELERGLHEALEVAAADLARQKEFMQVVGIMRSRMRQELEETDMRLKSTMDRILHSLYAYAVDSFKGSLGPAIDTLQQKTDTLEFKLQTVATEADKLGRTLHALHQESAKRDQELADAQQRELETTRETALAHDESVGALCQDNLAKLLQFDASLRMPGIQKALNESEERTEQLHQAQLQQYEALQETSRLHQQQQIHLNGMLADLDKAAVIAAKMLKAIDQMGSKYGLDLSIQGQSL
ncbi:hypothetical protein ASPACDRAFT_57639 [Aspergillus aculeatus ATCC 16872]|uniref:Uncharacterized protein n=1 Tax=Aspergillus aculeatus (strain ATCC 16872 / CBS 172.66 / WB 5094) TaxID=690307 RepID=A0A1L9X2M2_ASPA1|nr:uncharacterized protein ASPACDRAFT_57639 [Aspergillus aculeatus ATCC 16872]OJK02636.1 hypothetical protein ASPACDRAFT_57639 [Aspergillus aculeatus ATCC 16872]